MGSFDFIYDLAVPYCPTNGHPSADPVSMFKMMLVGYFYCIKSERQLVQEIQLNIAYCWFCGVWNGTKNSWICLWRKLLWTAEMTLVLFTGVWNYWELPRIFLPSVFPKAQVNMDFYIIRSRIRLFAQ